MRAQAAMSFMMTYGWAFLVVVAAISALSYFGVLDMKESIPSSCLVGPGFACMDYKATDSTFTLSVRNTVNPLQAANLGFEGDALACTSAQATDTTGNLIPGVKTDKWWFNTSNLSVQAGRVIASVSFGGDCNFNRMATSDFTIEYIIEGDNVVHEAEGRAAVGVE